MVFDPPGFTGKQVSLPLERRNVRLGNGNDGSCSYLLWTESFSFIVRFKHCQIWTRLGGESL